jgi:hypothetical protein
MNRREVISLFAAGGAAAVAVALPTPAMSAVVLGSGKFRNREEMKAAQITLEDLDALIDAVDSPTHLIINQPLADLWGIDYLKEAHCLDVSVMGSL